MRLILLGTQNRSIHVFIARNTYKLIIKDYELNVKLIEALAVVQESFFLLQHSFSTRVGLKGKLEGEIPNEKSTAKSIESILNFMGMEANEFGDYLFRLFMLGHYASANN